MNIAGLDDIACMKMTALLRAEYKDYVDLYYILKHKTLNRIIIDCKKKYKDFDEMVYLKALGSFDGINMTNILFKRGKKVSVNRIKKDFAIRIRNYLNKII